MTTTSGIRDRHATAPQEPIRADRSRPHGTLRGLRHQLRYDLLAQLRNPTAAFFSVALPVLFLLAFTAVGGSGSDGAEYYTPATMIIAVVSGTLTNLAVTLAYLREYGLLKRVLLTPLSRAAYLGSRVLAAAVLALAGVLLLGVIGVLAYDTTPAQPLHLLLAVLVGLLAGSALGVALAAVVPSETASAPVANAVGLPLLLLSGAFFPLEQSPAWLERTASVLPVTPVVELATGAYTGDARLADVAEVLLVGGAWTAVALLVARWRFSWAPRRRR